MRVFTEFEVAVHAARFNADEVETYLPGMAAKYGLPPSLVEMQWRLLPLALHDLEEYRGLLAPATAELASRDPEDAHALALARHLDLPLWTNDRDFEWIAIERHSTARLLAILRRQRESQA